MKFRKSALLIAAVAFLFAWVTPVVSLADDDMDVGDLSAILTTTVNSFDVGDTVYVDITLDGNTGVSVLDLNLNYDTDKLTYDNSATYRAADFADNDIVSITGGNGVISISLESPDGFYDSGEFVTLVFTANQADTEADVYISSFSYSDPDDNEIDTADEDDSPDADTSDSKKDDSSSKNNTGKTGTTSTKNNTGKTNTTKRPAKTDKSYKTGVGLGNNIFLVVAVVTGAVGAGAMAVTKRKEK